MTEGKIIEGNKLIAEFMGVKIVDNDIFYEFKDVPEHIWRFRIDQMPVIIQDLMYHESWDWLMPVIIKIHNTSEYRISLPEFVKDFEGEHSTLLWNVKTMANRSFYTKDNPMDCIWEAVVYFIQKYGNGNK